MPIHEAVSAILAEIDASIELTRSQFDELCCHGIAENTAAGLVAFEQQTARVAQGLAAMATARSLQETIGSGVLDDAVHDLVGGLRGKYRNVAWRRVTLTLTGGIRVEIAAPYYARRAGRAAAKGFYPHLLLLGIFNHVTAALASMVAKYAVALASFEEARTLLAEQGVSLNIKTVRAIAKAFANRARVGQAIAAERGEGVDFVDDKKKNLIVLSADGGRIRLRRKKRGRLGKTTKRRGYRAEWKEPKMIIIYVVDADGRLDSSVPPIIDATLVGPNRAFELLAFYLRRLNLTAEDEIAFIADGARWIWDRVKGLLNQIPIKGLRLVELLDFYHAMQHVHEIARLKKGWTARRKGQWAKKLRRWFKDGKHTAAIAEIQRYTEGAKGLLRRERRYFIRNAHRLDYAAMRRRHRPIGSGAMESAIRRVINLRLKGPGIIWLEATANEMLFLRSFYKSGRWDEIERWATCPQVIEGRTQLCK